MSQPSTSARAPSLYVIHFPLTHPTFRFAVLRSVAQQHGIPLTFYPLPPDQDVNDDFEAQDQGVSYQDVVESYDPSYSPEADVARPFAIVGLRSDEDACILLERCTVVRNIFHLWALAPTAEGLRRALRHPSSQSHWAAWQSEQYTWKADVTIIGVKMSLEEKMEIIEQTQFLGFRGSIALKGPAFEWAWYEERWGLLGAHIPTNQDASKLDKLRLAVAGRKMTLPSGHMPARDWVNKLDLKKRQYIGNTSMESEMSLNMAEMAQASTGRIIYDPFVGTGSLLIAAAALGAYVMGSDIDGRMIRGKRASKDPRAETGIITAAKQYGIRDKFLDCLTFDVTQHPWRLAKQGSTSSCRACSPSPVTGPRREQGLLDSVIADPPYGVRAGAKRLGQRDTKKQRTEPIWLEDKQGWAHEQEDYIPPTRPYALNDLLADLLTFSAKMLKDDGRLVFWMPVMNEDEEGEQKQEIPTGREWECVAVSTQDFGRWARKLVTLRRLPRASVCSCSSGKGAVSEDASSPVPAAASTLGSDNAPNVQGYSDGQTQFHFESGRYRANVDQADFRNKFFGPH